MKKKNIGQDLCRSHAFLFTKVGEVSWASRWWFQIFVLNVHPENWGRWTQFDEYTPED